MKLFIIFFVLIISMNPLLAMGIDDNRSENSAAHMLVYGLDAYDLVNETSFMTRLIKYNALKKRLKSLLAQGANINCCSPDGKYSPLSKAAARGDLEQCKILLEFGAYINITDAHHTPLTAALMCPFEKDRKKICEWLIENGADVNFPNDSRRGSPLSVAMLKVHTREQVSLLLKLGADPLAQDERGWNALMHAAIATRWRSWNSPGPLLLQHLVRKYSIVFRSDLMNFLCVVNRLRKSPIEYEQMLGSVLFLNRQKIIQHFADSLREILSISIFALNQTAYDIVCMFRPDDNEFFTELLNPDKVSQSEQIIVQHIREVDQARRQQKECAIQ